MTLCEFRLAWLVVVELVEYAFELFVLQFGNVLVVVVVDRWFPLPKLGELVVYQVNDVHHEKVAGVLVLVGVFVASCRLKNWFGLGLLLNRYWGSQ